MKLTLKQYQEAVKITECSYRETAAYFHAKLTPKNRPRFALLHGIMGICDEAGELYQASLVRDTPNAKEEVGDMLWFITITCRELGVNLSALLKGLELPENIMWGAFMAHVCALAGIDKKAIFYGDKRKLRGICRPHLFKIVIILKIICRECGFTLSAAMEANIAKLQKRYGAKFTAEKALHRDPAAEMQAMNGGAR